MSSEYDLNFCIKCEEKFEPENTITECINCYNTEHKWISIKERLPENKKTVLAYDGNNIVPVFYHDTINYWMAWSGWKNMDLSIFKATHWMPLPEPPID